MVGIKEIIISFALLGLFAFALISFTYQTTLDNNPTSSLLNEPRLNETFVNINSTLGSFTTTSTTQLNASQNEKFTGGAFGLVSFAVIGAVNTFTGLVTSTYNILTTLVARTLHIPAIVLNLILAMIFIAIIFSAWRMYRQGN